MVPGNNREATLPTMPNMAIERGDGVPVPVQKVTRGEPLYPVRLAGLANPPAALWWVGRLPARGAPCVAIVGSRAASGTGRRRAQEWARALAERGFALVSGGAFGLARPAPARCPP